MLESVKTTLQSVRRFDQVVCVRYTTSDTHVNKRSQHTRASTALDTYISVTQPVIAAQHARRETLTCTCMSCADLKMVSFIQRIRAACCCCWYWSLSCFNSSLETCAVGDAAT
jgi:hypothetical protein